MHRELRLGRRLTIGLVAPASSRFGRGTIRLGTLSRPRVVIRYVIAFGVLVSFEWRLAPSRQA